MHPGFVGSASYGGQCRLCEKKRPSLELGVPHVIVLGVLVQFLLERRRRRKRRRSPNRNRNRQSGSGRPPAKPAAGGIVSLGRKMAPSPCRLENQRHAGRRPSLCRRYCCRLFAVAAVRWRATQHASANARLGLQPRPPRWKEAFESIQRGQIPGPPLSLASFVLMRLYDAGHDVVCMPSRKA